MIYINKRERKIIKGVNKAFKKKVKRGDFKKPKYKDYKEYLKSKEWGRLREKILKRAGGICEICKTHHAQQVHHKTYKRVYKEKESDLIAVCVYCHKFKHNILSDEEIEAEVNWRMKREGYY